jgi:methyl-accepting chemotaxis protein
MKSGFYSMLFQIASLVLLLAWILGSFFSYNNLQRISYRLGRVEGAESAINTLESGSPERLSDFFAALDESALLVRTGHGSALKNLKNDLLEQQNTQQFSLGLTTLIYAGLLFLIVLLYNLIFMRRISKSTATLKENIQALAEGRLDSELQLGLKGEFSTIEKYLHEFQQELLRKGELIEHFSEGNFITRYEAAHEHDSVGLQLNALRDNIIQVLSRISHTMESLENGAGELAESSQVLNRGSIDQASSLEEISSSLSEINGQAKLNFEHSKEASLLAQNASDDANKGNGQMFELLQKMNQIIESSDKIKKVVKVIDDIAFQINLLALNANIEAARAGKYGRGFAVVAEEVRNLAHRSADAVKNTTRMVEDTMQIIDEGSESAEQTAGQLKDIVAGVNKVSMFLEEISSASGEQAEGIAQISISLERIDQITQSNARDAEKTAEISRLLKNQISEIDSLLQYFQVSDQDSAAISQEKPIALPSSDNSNESESSGSSPEQSQMFADPKPDIKQQNKSSNETGIQPVDPSVVIKLEDDDFEGF